MRGCLFCACRLAILRYQADGRGRSYVQRGKGLGLDDLDEGFAQQLQYRQESHSDAHAPLLGVEQIHERRKAARPDPRENLRHALPYGQRLPLQVKVREHLGTLQYIMEGQQQFFECHLRQLDGNFALRSLDRNHLHVALEPREVAQILGGLLEALILLEAPDQLGPGSPAIPGQDLEISMKQFEIEASFGMTWD